MMLDKLEVWLAAQIIGPYHAERHRGICVPPALAWAEAMERRPELGRLPVDRASILFDFLPREARAVTPHGIELFHLHYWDDGLSCWCTRPEQTIPIRWDPRDLSRIWLATSGQRFVGDVVSSERQTSEVAVFGRFPYLGPRVLH